MKQIEQSSWIKFLREIKGKGYKKNTIYSKFNKMVDKDDYLSSEKTELINYALKYGLKS